MKATPVRGTKDYLPAETLLRDHLQDIILDTYRSAGFERITTPILEDAANLDKSEGGENLNLIFKILKRGQKLTAALEQEDITERGLSDLGLRYDLTLPLSRYYANNRADLLSPFKVIQMDRVYRAERPQKGRLREFMQCDIDIIGNPSPDAEAELILTTAEALERVGITDLTVKINDRRILKDLFANAGFVDKDHEKLSIIFDKQDKIGMDGVRAELTENGFDTEAIDRFCSLFESDGLTLEAASSLCSAPYTSDIRYIIDTVKTVSSGSIPIEFAPSLVRGQGYYTGTIFEIETPGYSGAVAGGGRYDGLIGKFLNEDIPAVGFSIGFERIFGILMEREHLIPERKKRIALFYEPGACADALIRARQLHQDHRVSVLAKPKKLGRYLKKLEAQGFDGFAVCGQEDGIKLFREDR